MRQLALLLAIGASTGLMAQEDQKWAAAHLGFDRFSQHSELTSQRGLGVSAGFWATEVVGLEARGIYMPEKSEAGHKSKEVHGLVSLLFNFRPYAANWYPYLAVGPGITRTGRGTAADSASYTGRLETAFTYHLGVGVIGHLSRHALVQGDAKLLRVDLNNPVSRNEFLVTLGIGWAWGGEKAFQILRDPAPGI